MIQIQFLDNNVVGALVPAYTMKPERVVFLYDERIVTRRGMKDITDALMLRLPKVQVDFVRGDMHNLADIWEKLSQVLGRFGKQEIQVDITGGTEIMTACGLLLCKEHTLTPTYVDFYQGQVFDVFTREKLAEVDHLTLNEYLCAIGGKHLDNSRETPEKKDFDRVMRMAEYVFAHQRQWHEFYRHMTNGYSAKYVTEFSMKKLVTNRGCMDILQMFLECGFCQKVGTDRYEYNSEMDKQCMTIKGTLLEAYTYIQASQCFDEVVLGARIDWNDSDHMDLKDNEIDVVVMHHSQPIFISCKMTDVENEAVYEVNALAKRLGGEYARSMIATTDNIRAQAQNVDGMFQRLKKMKMGLIETRDFHGNTAQDVFAKALRMTE